MSFIKTDSELKRDVVNELIWDPSISSDDILVSVSEGIVTFHGHVPHYFEKLLAEKAAQRVSGVKAVADELEVKSIFDKSDEEIAQAAYNAIKWNYSVPNDIGVSVQKGWITLRGQADWDYQRNAAKESVSELMGVTGVSNEITIKTKIQPSDIKSRIEEALKRSAEKESKQISVSVHGDKVTLSGKVHSFAEGADARLAAWMAPGVNSVVDNLKISRF